MSSEISRDSILQQTTVPSGPIHKKVANKAIKEVGEHVEAIGKHCIQVLHRLDEAFSSVGESTVRDTLENPAVQAITTLDGFITSQESLLAKLPKNEKSAKIEAEIGQCKQTLDLLKQKRDYLLNLNQPELVQAYDLQNKINDLLLEIDKNPKESIQFIKEAVDTFNQIPKPKTEQAQAKVHSMKAFLNEKIETQAIKALSLTPAEFKLKEKIKANSYSPLKSSPAETHKIFELLAKESAKAAYITGDRKELNEMIDKLSALTEVWKGIDAEIESRSKGKKTPFNWENLIKKESDVKSLAKTRSLSVPTAKTGEVDPSIRKEIMGVKVSGKDTKRMKFKAGLLDSLFERRGMKIAKSVNAFGAQCLKVDKYIDKTMLEVSRGENDKLDDKIKSMSVIITKA